MNRAGMIGRGATQTGAKRYRRGFTLMEMVIVIIIIGIMGLVVVPGLLDLSTTEAPTAMTPLVSTLRAAQRAAADSGRAVRVVIDPNTNQYVAVMDGVATPFASGTLEMPGGSIRTDSLRASITFEPQGASYGDSLFVTTSDQSGIVRADPWTGAIRVTPW